MEAWRHHYEFPTQASAARWQRARPREPGLESPAIWGPKKTPKNKKGKQKEQFCQQMTIFDGWPTLSENICFGGHFWKYKSPGGLPGTTPGFLETQISATSQGLKKSWSFFVKLLKFVARSSNFVALFFRCGSRYGSPGIDCLEK